MSEAWQQLTAKLAKLSAAEEFFKFFDVEYDASVLGVNRLHILKRFHQYLNVTKSVQTMEEPVLTEKCRELLLIAYNDFIKSTPAKEKVFKVFQDADGTQAISIDKLRKSMPSQQRGV